MLTSLVHSVGVDFVVTKVDVKPAKIIISLELSSKTTHFEIAWKVSANPTTAQATAGNVLHGRSNHRRGVRRL